MSIFKASLFNKRTVPLQFIESNNNGVEQVYALSQTTSKVIK